MTTTPEPETTEIYDGPFRRPLPCMECGGEIVWRYASDGYGDVDSFGECKDCGAQF